MNKYVCDKCGSANVRVCAWMDPNTNELSGSAWDRVGSVCDDCEANDCVITHDESEHALALKASRLIVSGWELIPEKVDALVKEHRLSLAARDTMTRHMRDLVGGEEVYTACKKFLEAEAKT